MVDGDSADVWARQDQFHLDASVGAPPDAFSATGQNWGMPVYRWDVVARDDFRWLRDRARRNAELFDGYRVDHLVGFYRTYGWPTGGGEPFFTPTDEPDQLALGERVLTVFRESGAHDHRRGSRHQSPTSCARRWRGSAFPGFACSGGSGYWHVEGQPFRDPSEYPALSVATSGTHDTETHGRLVGKRGGTGASADFRSPDGPADWRRRFPIAAPSTVRPCATSCSKRSSRPVPI